MTVAPRRVALALSLALLALSGSALTSSAAAAVFLAHSKGEGGFECLMVDVPGPAYDHRVTCISSGTVGASDELLMQEATLTPSGHVSVCKARGTSNPHHCNFGNPDENTPTYGSGKAVEEGRFRCKVLASAVRCTVTKSGRGFLVTTQRVTKLG